MFELWYIFITFHNLYIKTVIIRVTFLMSYFTLGGYLNCNYLLELTNNIFLNYIYLLFCYLSLVLLWPSVSLYLLITNTFDGKVCSTSETYHIPQNVMPFSFHSCISLFNNHWLLCTSTIPSLDMEY